ncbi:MAG: ShlB/FhaC/HecB family hemolysin secretion/activation protein [Vampirovibrionales bacterium]|nr:ShlB/FhaC/HecB family hemolysin secretion/activation protein [Vampirovibrionales bacterium]
MEFFGYKGILSRNTASVLAVGAISIMVASTLPMVASAQAIPNSFKVLPGSLTPDQKNPFTSQPNEIAPTNELPADVKEAPKDPVVEDESPEAPVLDPSLTKPIKINQINIEGATKLSEKEIEAITGPFIGKEVPFIEMQDAIADKLTDLYEEKGFITTLVFIPPQKIENGVILIKADEGVISEVRFEGMKYHYAPLSLRPRIDLHEGDVFKVQDLKRSLRRINENPDLALQATLKPGKESGQTEVVISPKEGGQVFPIHLTPFFDNLGREPIGLYRTGATLSSSNTLGLGDSAFSSFFMTRHSWGLINGYELPIASHGTKLGINFAHTHFDFSQDGNDFRGRSSFYLPYVSQELFRNERAVVTAELALGTKRSKFFANGTRINADSLFVVNPALSGRFYDKWGQTFVRSELSLGSILNEEVDSSRPNADRAFLKNTTMVSRVQRLPWQTYGIFKSFGQFSRDSLISLEQFQLGGNATVRGYKEGRMIGDTGVTISGEWHIPCRFIPETFNVLGYNLHNNLELVTFTDFGYVAENNAFNGVNPASGSVQSGAFAWGAGIGVRAKLTRLFNARMDLGVPLLKQQPDSNGVRIHFGLESRLF